MRTGALIFADDGATGLAVLSTPPITPPSCPPGTPPGTPPATPPRFGSGSRGAPLISAICFGMTVGAKSFPPFRNRRRTTGGRITALSAGGGGGGAISIVDASCLILIVSVKYSPAKMGPAMTTTCSNTEIATSSIREPVLKWFSSRRTTFENSNAGLISRACSGFAARLPSGKISTVSGLRACPRSRRSTMADGAMVGASYKLFQGHARFQVFGPFRFCIVLKDNGLPYFWGTLAPFAWAIKRKRREVLGEFTHNAW